ncbi:hypothetical protein B9Z47_06340 [Limnohabitans sp. 2KL-1]|uniref:beta strand repeat-containing protein n=1 Tax=Limnohabitans sp. 2KL-1 TaxID=1100699 RepID=UPI000D38BB3A|nr:DUF11 domain-containing protein [Limnohabitans sp. 2KL-1]PUE49117.1 hypothetical protein B9Z47_06340 [Limnohabitans sp. 2KL-1]
MSKKTSTWNKAFSNASTEDTSAPTDLLYGQVTALNATEGMGLSTSSALTSSTPATPTRDSGTATAQQPILSAGIAPAAITYPSTSISKVYQHWADGDAARATAPEWNNNILSDGKSDYFEGEVVPHVYFYKASNNAPLVTGQTYSFNITYNHYQANTNAGGFVYMTSPDASRNTSSFAGGDAQADSGFSNGGGMHGSFHTVNADITAVSGVSYLGSAGSSLDGKVTVTFVYTGPTTTSGGAEIQYGLLIAAPGNVADQGKGMTDGANAWTGGSLQTTVDINGSGATSIQLAPSAIIVGEISGMKFSDLDGNGTRDADGVDNLLGTADDEVGLANWKIFVDKDNDGAWDEGEQFALTGADGKYALSVVPDSDRTDADNDAYIVREVQVSGWVQTTANPAPILITALDPTELNVNFGNMLQMPSLNIIKEATVEGNFADAAGDVISYSISVQNTGNQTLTGVTVSDPFISDLTRLEDAATADNELDVGETWHYTATHSVTQAELDAGSDIVNTATADSDQTGPDTDDAAIPVYANPLLNITKEALVPGGTADAAGEVISYTIAVQNLGNLTLTNVTVTDPFISDLTRIEDATTANNALDVGETWHYTASHVVLQSEIDAGGNINNTATADSLQTGPDSADAFVPVEQRPALNITKDASIDGGTADQAGEIISYSIAVQNLGNQTLTNVTVTDPFISDLALINDAASADNELDVGETWHYTASHAVTQFEIDTGTHIVNTATADSDQTGEDTDDAAVPVVQTPALAIDKAITGISGGNGNGSLDAVNDVIGYTVTVINTGNQTLNQVTVDDPMTGLTISGVTLAPGASQTYQTSYTLTQNDLDTYGGGDGFIENTATADSLETGPVSDTEEIEIFVRSALSIDKRLVNITGGNGNTVADAVGDTLNYTVTVTNLGVLTLTNVSVVDPNSGLNITGVTLAPGESQVYITDYVLTQADLDNNGQGDGYIDNIATADADQTVPVSDNESTALLRTVGLGIEKSVTSVGGGNNNLFVDAPGDVIQYAIRVYNAGTVTLTGVTVTDELTGLAENVPDLAPGASTTYTTSYTLLQADLDNNGGGDGRLDNTSVGDSDQTTTVSDTESVQLLAVPILFVDKSFVNVTGGNGNGIVDAVGDQLNYQIVLANAGNVTLTDVSLVESLTSLSYTGMTLAPKDVAVYNVSYTLTQADLDNNGGGDGYIDNIATADSAQTIAISDTESVPLLQRIGMAFDKEFQGVTGGNGNNLADFAGDVLNYSFDVTNLGSVTLTNVTVVDDLTGLSETLASLAPGATQTYTSTYTLQQTDLDSDGGGNRQVENYASADTDQTGTLVDFESVAIIYDAQIDLTKYVSVDGGGTWDDANTLTGPTLSSSASINPMFKYTALNNGTVTLHGVTLTDAAYDLNGGDAGTTWDWGTLAPGALAEFVFEAPFTPGQNSGDATVTATALSVVVDIDNAYYLGV